MQVNQPQALALPTGLHQGSALYLSAESAENGSFHGVDGKMGKGSQLQDMLAAGMHEMALEVRLGVDYLR